jgi:glutaminyl-peptide cyclotransferase
LKIRSKPFYIFIAVDVLIIIAVITWLIWSFQSPEKQGFNRQRAYKDAEYQMSLGPRTPGSASHEQARQWIKEELSRAGWDVSEQISERLTHPVQNIVAKRGKGAPWILLAAHYDCRLKADRDKDLTQTSSPVPGANDGASGVAVLLELARSLPVNLDKEVWLVFIDAEDQGDFPGWDWILGSRVFADSLTTYPQAVVVVDMIGDHDLNIYYEKNSNKAIMTSIWQEAARNGFDKQFIPTYKWSMEDDHTPFLEKGIPAVDIIDFDYPYWHTTADTLDKISSESLNMVGTTLYQWILKTKGNWQK